MTKGTSDAKFKISCRPQWTIFIFLLALLNIRLLSTLDWDSEPNDGNIMFLSNFDRTAMKIQQQEKKLNFTCTINSKESVNLPVFPNFIIVGAQKAGTTAISKLLNAVPSIQKSKMEEPHFWDRLGTKNLTEVKRCKKIRIYSRKFDQMAIHDPKKTLFEKTPSLLGLPYVPARIREVLFPYVPKIIVILRDPIERFYSHAKMNYEAAYGKEPFSATNASNVISATFFERIEELIQEGFIRRCEDNASNNKCNGPYEAIMDASLETYTSGLTRGFYSHQLKFYLEHFELGKEMMVIQYENFTENGAIVLNSILKFVGIPSHNWTTDDLTKDRSPRQKKMNFDPLPKNIEMILKSLYRPSNQELAKLLGPEWESVWI